jgi:hypothetical protein
MTLIEALKDLHYQATTERSHYYTGKLVKQSIARIEALEQALRDARTWHEAADKALSKQPPSSDGSWQRLQHQEQMAEIDAALAQTGEPTG